MAVRVLKLGQYRPGKHQQGCIGVSDVGVLSFLFLIYFVSVDAAVFCV
jgi:hypothetical protein